MASTHQVLFRPTNQIWSTYKHFPYKAWHAIGELVDNSTQSFFDHRIPLTEAFEKAGTVFQVSIDFDPRARVLTVADNAMGMDLEELKRAVLLASAPPDTSGRCEFGMGLKTAASWLGDGWSVRTKKLGATKEFSFEVDIGAHARSDADHITVVEKVVPDVETHYTVVVVRGVRSDFQRRSLGKVKQFLANMYRKDIAAGSVLLTWNTDTLSPTVVEPLETSSELVDAHGVKSTVSRVWRMPVEFDVVIDADLDKKASVRGWVCILKERGRARAGFDLSRRGRGVVGRPTGYRPERIFGEDANNLINQRLYGELELDDFPVNHLKDDFLWGEWRDDLEDRLKEACAEYVRFARDEFRPGKGGASAVSPAIVAVSNDEIAESLSTDEMVDRIHMLESVGPSPELPPEVKKAEAEILRDQPSEPRIVELQGKTFRIFHPVAMKTEQAYVRYEAPDADTIDIFINDNHPHVVGIPRGPAGAERYQAHANTCVIDAIAVHLLTVLARDIAPEAFIRYKDQLLRAMQS